MPIRSTDPFADPTLRLRSDVNPWLGRMIAAGQDPRPGVLYGPGLKEACRQWRDHFPDAGRPGRLIVEIGSHNGDVLIALAKARPGDGFIGLDITFKRVVTLADKAAAAGAGNVLSVLANAGGISRLFPPASVDGFIIFFPDPWVKKQRQQKKQLLGPGICRELADLTAPGGFVWFKTDQFNYFKTAVGHFNEAGFSERGTLPAGIDGPFESRFERHFTELGVATHEIILERREAPAMGLSDKKDMEKAIPPEYD